MPRPVFPRNFSEFQAQFCDEDACRAYLAASRWPDGYCCPRCAHGFAFELPRRKLWQCKSCGHQVSATAGSVLHRTRAPLRDWFWAAYLVTSHTPGMSALQLQRQLGIRYETAWTMLHKLRRAMRRPERERLYGKVEADETYVGRQENLRGGRQAGDRAIVVGAVEIRAEGSGRLRLQVVPDVSGPALTEFIRANVEPGTIVITDGWQGYAPLAGMGYRHRAKTQGDVKTKDVTPRMHRAFGNLKTWLRGTHHGVSKKHMQVYLDEFVFRFNRRRTPMAAFQSLLGLTSLHSPTTYKMLYASESTG